jgi:4a-hydroxytetrahydrobiopterin dehydratase
MWQEQDNKLKQHFEFKDFKEAFAFLTEIALAAEAMNHHPWWSNMYKSVTIELFSFDAGNTVTNRDRKLAAVIDAVFEKYKPGSAGKFKKPRKIKA